FHVTGVQTCALPISTLMAEVSRIDPSITVNGIPGFLTRRTHSEVNVRNGETIVISGLTDINAAKSADKFPILGEIPILGRLFRRSEERRVGKERGCL